MKPITRKAAKMILKAFAKKLTHLPSKEVFYLLTRSGKKYMIKDSVTVMEAVAEVRRMQSLEGKDFTEPSSNQGIQSDLAF